jgi:hypothetical protein
MSCNVSLLLVRKNYYTSLIMWNDVTVHKVPTVFHSNHLEYSDDLSFQPNKSLFRKELKEKTLKWNRKLAFWKLLMAYYRPSSSWNASITLPLSLYHYIYLKPTYQLMRMLPALPPAPPQGPQSPRKMPPSIETPALHRAHMSTRSTWAPGEKQALKTLPSTPPSSATLPLKHQITIHVFYC